MASELKLRRGNSAQHAVFIGAEGEITANTDNHSVHIHDGVTEGGFEMARSDLANVDNTTFAAKAAAAGVSGGSGGSYVTGGAPLDAAYLVVALDGSLTAERRLQTGNGLTFSDGGPGGGYTIAASFSSNAPINLGSANPGSSTNVARADHIHAMPTSTDIGAVPTSRQVIAGSGLSGGGALSSNVTVSLSANLDLLTDVSVASPTNGDVLIYNGATSRFENSQNFAKLTTKSTGTVVGTTSGVKTLNFTGGGATITADAGDPAVVNVNVSPAYTQEEIEDFVGAMVSGNSESGINVTYDDASGKLNFAINSLTVTLSGDLQGTATTNSLGTLSINTTIAPDSVSLGSDTTGNFVASVTAGTAILLSNAAGSTEGSAYTIALDVNDATLVEAIQDVVGSMVTGNTENGINVTYDDPSGKLNFQTNNFTVSLGGALSGSASINNLSSATLTASMAANSVALGTHTTGDYIATISGADGILVTGSGGEGASVNLSFDGANTSFVSQIQSIVGTMVTGNAESGVALVYNSGTGKIDSTAGSLTVTLTGAMTGTATRSSGLGTLSITTAPTNHSIALGTHTTGDYVATLSGGSGPITFVNGAAGAEGATYTASLNTSETNFVEAIQDIVGAMVTGNTETGISVIYDDAAAKLNYVTGTFNISLAGSVSGSGTVNSLSNVTITTTPANDAITLGTHTSGNYVATLAAGTGITLANANVPAPVTEGALFTVSVNANDTDLIESLQDIVGAMVTGNTESGIAVTYDDPNGKLNFQTNNFTITVGGAITGSGVVSNLGNVSITTYQAADSVALGTHTTGSYVAAVSSSGPITSTGSGEGAIVALSFDATNTDFVESIQDIIGTMVTGNTENGIAVTYDDPNGKLNFQTNNFTITVGGAVTGSGIVTNLGNVSITTLPGLDSITLGTHTSGSYVASVAISGTGLSVSGSGEGAAVVITSNATDANLPNTIVSRDASGNFSAGTITASVFSGAVTSTQRLQTARTIALSGDMVGSVSFDGSSNVTLSTAMASVVAEGTYTRVVVDVKGRVISGSQAASSISGTDVTNALGYTPVNRAGDTLTGGLVMAAGTTTIAPFRFQAGSVLTAPVAHTVEWDGSNLYVTQTGPSRKTIAYTDSSISGNASTATALSSVRAFALTGDVTGSVSSNLSSGASITTTLGTVPITKGGTGATTASAALSALGALPAAGGTLTGAVVTTGITPTANNVSAIGASTLRYSTVFATTFNGTATAAEYADVAERYQADAVYEPGDVVCFGGEFEITTSTVRGDHRVAGVISTNPAYMMNADAGPDATHPYVALLGRVPCKVVGAVQKGDILITSDVPGHAVVAGPEDLLCGRVVGKALANKLDEAAGVVEVVVGRG
jgi:hypothetical protein